MTSRLAWVVSQCFDTSVESLVLEALATARIQKVKRHSLSVYQERADYLARHSAQVACAVAEEQLLTLDEWLKKGILTYDKALGTVVTWRAPFVQESLA